MALSLRGEPLTARETAKFGILVGLAAIFIDAVIAHGLFWENDPYWTYWITKSFLIATVFIVGTAFLGIGIVQGLIITAVHTAILEVYYEWLAPVGLPQEPEWLDDKHLWTTGVPAHYLSILTGYFIALWIWRRAVSDAPVDRPERAAVDGDRRSATAAALAVSGLVTAVIILLLSGIITHAILLGSFPGITYFVQHLLVGFVFLYLWSAYVGMGGGGWIVAALMLALVWVSYGMYLGPTGLPERVHYLGYHDLWFRAFPGDFVAALLGLFAATQLLPRLSVRVGAYSVPAVALLLVFPQEAEAKPKGMPATASAQGQAHRVIGPDPVNMSSTVPATGSIRIEVIEAGNRWSHVQSKDWVGLVANFTAPDGRYRVVVDRPMPRHPTGKYTTWNGVAFNHEMHGETGIGTDKLPLMKPEISIYGWGKLYRNGELVTAMTPVHAMVTSKGPMAGVMLEVDTEEKLLKDVPDGYINVHWPKIASLDMPKEMVRQREWIGWAGMIGLALLFGWLAWKSERRKRT